MDELEVLIDDPAETLEAEYKDWLDFEDEVNRANIARHIAALSNHGGGYLVFGFHDTTMVPTGVNPYVVGYSHDDFASIARRYLEPSIQVGVRQVRGHVALTVPPHGPVPICAKKNGPGDSKGRPQGIQRGAYYVRKPGPESAPIVTEAEWTPIIRRCVMHDKSALFAALTSALSGTKASDKRPPLLETWHRALRAAYLGQNGVKGTRIARNNAQFSYAIIRDDPSDTLPPEALLEVLSQVNKESASRVNTGWSMFFPFTRQPIRPYFTSDPASGLESEEFLEANLLLDGDKGADTDMWRVSPTGLASIIRPIRYDYMEKPGWSDRYFSINEAARNLGQLVRHAEALSQRFDTAREVLFLCEWDGLGDRELADPNVDWSPGRVSRTRTRLTRGTWSIGEITAEWPSVVASLLSPLVRAFDPSLQLSPEWVLRDSERWRPMGNQWP